MTTMFKTSNTAQTENFRTMTTIFQPSNTAPTAAPSLHVRASALTAYIFGDGTLPDYLSAYAPLVLQILGYAAAGIGIIHWFGKHHKSRAKVKLAVFYIVRHIERSEEYGLLVEDPVELASTVELEVLRLMDEHLTTEEGDQVMSKLKRKAWDPPLETPAAQKRLRTEIDNDLRILEQDSKAAARVDGRTASAGGSSSGSSKYISADENIRDEEDELPSLSTPNHNSIVSHPASTVIVEHEPISAVQSLKVGYSLNYDDFSASSSPTENSPTEEAQQRKPGLVERAMRNAFDPNSPGNESLRGQFRPGSSAKRRHNTRVSLLATSSVARGTSLTPIAEGSSLSSTPDVSRTQYTDMNPAQRDGRLGNRPLVPVEALTEPAGAVHASHSISYSSRSPIVTRSVSQPPSSTRSRPARASASTTPAPRTQRPTQRLSAVTNRSTLAATATTPARRGPGRPSETPDQPTQPPPTALRRSGRNPGRSKTSSQ